MITGADSTDNAVLLVIFGITGDLAQRYILPALYSLHTKQLLPAELKIVGVSRRNINLEDVYAKLPDSVGKDYDDAAAQTLKSLTTMRQMDLDDPLAYERLLHDIELLENGFSRSTQRLYYLSVPPDAFLPMVSLLGKTGHARQLQNENDLPRLMIEKPFGHNLDSARSLLGAIAEYYDESQTYRIDHYVAKRTVQAIVRLRFTDARFAELWRNASVSSVSVVAYEKLDIKGRAGFYEQTGALRDLIQSHLMQVLALSVMEAPATKGDETESPHHARLHALQTIEPVKNVTKQTLRAQYKGYTDEVENLASTTETFARVTVRSRQPRWQSSEFVLETGKAMPERLAYVELTFAEPTEFAGHQLDRLRFRIQPDPTVIGIKGSDGAVQEIEIDADFADNAGMLDGYERVVHDAIRGDRTTFSTADEIICSWQILQPVLDGWQADSTTLYKYPKGTYPKN